MKYEAIHEAYRRTAPKPTGGEIEVYRASPPLAIRAYSVRTGYSAYESKVILERAFGLGVRR